MVFEIGTESSLRTNYQATVISHWVGDNPAPV